jgi:hypothetical protein
MAEEQKTESGFKDLLTNIMNKRWNITALVLGSFVLIIGGVFAAIVAKTPASAEWKELLLLMLGAFIGSYGKIIDYWFSDQDKDKLLVAKMDEENDTPEVIAMKMEKGISSGDMKLTGYTPTQVIPDAFVAGASAAREMAKVENLQNFELAKDQQEHEQEIEKMELEWEHQEHRQCQHVWGDADNNGEEECQLCGKIKDPDHHDVTEG